MMHHSKQMIVEPAWCLSSAVLISLLLCSFVCLVYLDHKFFEVSVLGLNGNNMINIPSGSVFSLTDDMLERYLTIYSLNC